MTTNFEITYHPDWEWADEIFAESDWADIFDVERKEFDPKTGFHYYISDFGGVITINIDGDVLIGKDD